MRPIFFVAAAVLLVLFSFGCNTAAPDPVTPDSPPAAAPDNTDSAAAPLPGNPAPDFTLKTINGQQVTLSDLRGQKVFLNFWASWCAPCKNEMPALQTLSREYEDKVKVYGVNMLSDDNIESAERFMLENALTFPSLLDETGAVKKAYRIVGLPVSITIDEQGRIVDVHKGELKQTDMKNLFSHLLSSQPEGQATP